MYGQFLRSVSFKENCALQPVLCGNLSSKWNCRPGSQQSHNCCEQTCWRVNAPVVFLCFYFVMRLSRRSRVPCKRSFTVASHHGVWNHQQLHHLFNSLSSLTTKKPPKLCISDLLWGNLPISVLLSQRAIHFPYHWPFVRSIHWWLVGAFPHKRASDEESVFMP